MSNDLNEYRSDTAKFCDRFAAMADEAMVFALPRNARIEYLSPKPRRTLGAWRRKVMAPDVLIHMLTASWNVLTEETRAACRFAATNPGALTPPL